MRRAQKYFNDRPGLKGLTGYSSGLFLNILLSMLAGVIGEKIVVHFHNGFVEGQMLRYGAVGGAGVGLFLGFWTLVRTRKDSEPANFNILTLTLLPFLASNLSIAGGYCVLEYTRSKGVTMDPQEVAGATIPGTIFATLIFFTVAAFFIKVLFKGDIRSPSYACPTCSCQCRCNNPCGGLKLFKGKKGTDEAAVPLASADANAAGTGATAVSGSTVAVPVVTGAPAPG